MAIRFRTYILDGGGRLRRVPRRVCEGLIFGYDALPEYAGTRQRIIEAVVENEDGRPARILDAKGCYWVFDEQGKINKGLQHSAWAALETGLEAGRASHGKVVDLRPELKRKAFRDEHRWNVTAEDLDRIAADLWPGLADVAEIATVKGKAPRKPAVSYDAKHAIREISTKIGDIERSLEELSEHSLKGLAYEARRLAKAYPVEGGPIWAVVADEAEERAKRADHIAGFEANGNMAVKLMRTFTAQVEALARLRRGGNQTVRVEHVHVYEGGQAIVGNVNAGGGGGHGGSADQPHAPGPEINGGAFETESGVPVWGPDAHRDALPVARGVGQRAMPDARGSKGRRSPKR